MGSFGLQSHIWNNNLKSIALLAGFPVLLLVLLYGVTLIVVGLTGVYPVPSEGFRVAGEYMGQIWPYAFFAAFLWFCIAWLMHTQMINAAAKTKGLSRKEAPELYNLVENLCISKGMPTPALRIMETPALNAFASGIDEKSYTIAVTRGLIETLDKEELEAVLAHELTHIRNRDVRLLIISVIFVGIFAFVGELAYHSFLRTGMRIGGHTRSRNGDSRGGGILIIAAVIMIAIAYFTAIAIRFALSQKREYLADAGAVDLTRNPDGMVRALEKISGRSAIEAPDDVRQMMVDNDHAFLGVFATHPPIEKRIAALRAYGG